MRHRCSHLAFVVGLAIISGCHQSAPTPTNEVRTFCGRFGALSIDTCIESSWRSDEGMLFIVWTDATSEDRQDSLSSTQSEGTFKTSTDDTIDWRFTRASADQPTVSAGTMTINGTAYSLADGAVFLVESKNDSVVVKQLKRDMTSISGTRESIHALARDSDVEAFFNGEPEIEDADNN